MATAKKKKQKEIKVDFIKTYGVNLDDLDLNDQQFRFTCVRTDLGNFRCDDIIEQVEWRDEGSEDNVNTIPILRGSVQFRKPAPDDVEDPPVIRNGHRLRCEVNWGGVWKSLWEMRMLEDSLRVEDGTWSFDMNDDLALLALTNGSFKYKKGKKTRTNGWRYDEIVRDIAKRYKIPLGKIAKGTEQIDSFVESDVPVLEGIRLALERERKATGRRYVIKWAPIANGKFGLCIVPMRRNDTLYVLKDQLVGANVQRKLKGTLATTVVGHGFVKKGKNGKRKKIKVRVTDRKGMKRYGYVEREVTYNGPVRSRGAIVTRAKRTLAKGLEPVRIIEDVTHPGVAYVRRGDAMRISIPEEGYSGKTGVVFVTAVTHSLSGGDYTMNLSLGFVDPQDPNEIRKEREAAARAKKRAEKAKKDDDKDKDS